MKITKQQLKQIIKEELETVLKEADIQSRFEKKQEQCSKLKQGSDEKKECLEELDELRDEAERAQI
tara:strand:+ start:208 stop:405 length:198 start_codon:yes stop_codon:yes gene_type:complete